MANDHIIELIGYLANDPRNPVSHLPDFITFTIPITTKWKDKNGCIQEKTTWYNCSSSNGIGQIIKKYAKKGTQVLVRGIPSINIYQGKDGESKGVINVAVKTFLLLSSKEKETYKEENATHYETTGSEFVVDLDDEIPF